MLKQQDDLGFRTYLFSIFIWYFGCICHYRKGSILEHFVSISVSVLYGIARVLFISTFMFILFYIQIISKLTNIFGFSVLFVHLEIVYKFSQIKIFISFLSSLISVWNSLPQSIALSPNLESFKSGISTLTFEGFPTHL